MEHLIWLKCDAYDCELMDAIKLKINGEMREVPPVANVKELLQFLGISESQVALELNRKIIRRGEWEETSISNLDQVEIVQFVGGG
jgi:sulfur carrier protein